MLSDHKPKHLVTL